LVIEFLAPLPDVHLCQSIVLGWDDAKKQYEGSAPHNYAELSPAWPDLKIIEGVWRIHWDTIISKPDPDYVFHPDYDDSQIPFHDISNVTIEEFDACIILKYFELDLSTEILTLSTIDYSQGL
jgi:hypothetical protein